MVWEGLKERLYELSIKPVSKKIGEYLNYLTGVGEVLFGIGLGHRLYMLNDLLFEFRKLVYANPQYPYENLLLIGFASGILIADGAARIIGSYFNKPWKYGFFTPVTSEINRKLLGESI